MSAKTLRAARWGILLPALIIPLACGGSGTNAPGPQTATAAPAKVTAADPSKWPADDHTMCDWKNKPEMEADETAGPGALKPNVRRVYKTFGEGDERHKTLVCREIDTNLDGIKDVVRTFNAKGEAIHEEADSNYDGKLDVWISFVAGRISEEDLDTNFDGKVDTWKFYIDGQLSRVKRDTNFDGKADTWEIYTKGHLERMGVDVTGDGHVDRWDRDMVAQRAAEEAEVATRVKMQQAASDGGAPPDAGDAGDASLAKTDAGKVTRPRK
jgi:hypothetical protein